MSPRPRRWFPAALLIAPVLPLLCGLASPPEAAGEAGARPPFLRPLRFHSEEVRLHVEEDSLRVEGSYRFVFRPEARGFADLFYPYPADSLLGGARTLALEARRSSDRVWRAIEAREVEGNRGARWRLPACPGDTLDVRTVYRQHLRSTSARYIVTTTGSWNEPLARARFEIHLPPGSTPIRFSFPFREEVRDGRVLFVFEAESFLPREDIVVEWSSPERAP